MFIQETKRFGRIATINPRAVPFDAERLRVAIWGRKYDTYELLGGSKFTPEIRVAPSGVVLRQNYPQVEFGRPSDFDGLLTSARVHERELNRLRRCGVGILQHTTFVVEKDPYYGCANAYTAVEQCPTKNNIDPVNNPISDKVYSRALNICEGLLRYWRDHDTYTRQITFDEISSLHQYSEGGPLLDYDICLETGVYNRLEGLDCIARSMRRLPLRSVRQEQLQDQMRLAIDDLHNTHLAQVDANI